MDIPARLHCAYCLRNNSHGGECHAQRNSETGCLAFSADPRGCIRADDLVIEVPLYYDLKPFGTWMDDFTYKDVDTSIKINRVQGIRWNTKKGTLILHCECSFFVNEYHENYEKSKSAKPRLTIVK